MPLETNYTTLANVKAMLGAATSAGDDAYINSLLGPMSRQIDRYCGQAFGLDDSDTSRTWYAHGEVVFMRPLLNSITSLTIDGVATTTYYLDTWGATPTGTVPPYRVLWLRDYNWVSWFLKAYPYPYPFYAAGTLYYPARQVVVTGKFGWPAVPDTIEFACRQMVVRAYFARNIGFSDNIGVASPNGGQAQYPVSRMMPTEVKQTLDFYKLVNL